MKLLKRITEPTLEVRLRAGKFEGLDPDEVEAHLGSAPVHVYDYGMQPEWIKRARQWVYEARLPEFTHPVHGWSLGVGGPRSPFTFFVCKHCGEQEMGAPYEPQPHKLIHFGFRTFDDPHEPEWEVASRGSANAGIVKALGDTSLYSLRDVVEKR